MNGERLKKLKKTLLAASLVAVMATNSTVVSAAIPKTSIEHNVDDEKDEKARTSADWKKIKEAYKSYDCNLDTDSIEALLEIEDFIEKNYGVYYDDELSKNFTVDDVISYRSTYYFDADGNEVEKPFSYNKLIAAYAKLDMKDDKAVADFLKEYGKYLADLHAHNYFTLITILSAIRNDVSWYVKQDVENSDWDALAENVKDAEAYRFSADEFVDGIISSDLRKVYLTYKNKEVEIDITAPNDENEMVGDGWADIASVHEKVLLETFRLSQFFLKTLGSEEAKTFLGASSFTVNGTTVDANKETDQAYSIEHNEEINKLIEEGLRVVKTLSPATTYNVDELNKSGVDVTALGYGHWFVGDPIFNYVYDETTDTYKISLNETFECPTLTYEEVLEHQQSSLTYKSN